MAEADIIVKALVVIAVTLLVVPILVLLFAWGKVARYLSERRRKRLLQLASNHARLLQVINHLLRRADHVDQLSKFYSGQTNDQWTRDLAGACEKLVVLTDSSKLIQSSLQNNNARQAEASLLQCIRVSHYVLIKLSNLERQLGSGDNTTFRVKNKEAQTRKDS